jgi:hypothetical protein
MIRRIIMTVMALMAFNTASYAADETPIEIPKTPIFGLIETVELTEHSLILNAKMDTGADNSSLNAIQIEEYDKEGQNRVRFKVPLRKGNKVKLIPFDLPVKRHTLIKARDQEGDGNGKSPIQRPVIVLEICIGDKIESVQVNLADRQNFKYHLLIGRRTIKKYHAMVDPSNEHLTVLKCPTHDKHS